MTFKQPDRQPKIEKEQTPEEIRAVLEIALIDFARIKKAELRDK